jgi:hypothetical protein
MSRICDRSPCDNLLSALGSFIFGCKTDNGKLEGFVMTAAVKHPDPHSKFKHKKLTVDLEYCPFCGTRIEEVNAMIVERFMRPRRRRRTKYDVVS